MPRQALEGVMRVGMLVLAWVALVFSACGGDDGGSKTCTPNQTVECPCPNGLSGFQTCDAQGAGFATPCQCTAAPEKTERDAQTSDTPAGSAERAQQDAAVDEGASVELSEDGASDHSDAPDEDLIRKASHLEEDDPSDAKLEGKKASSSDDPKESKAKGAVAKKGKQGARGSGSEAALKNTLVLGSGGLGTGGKGTGGGGTGYGRIHGVGKIDTGGGTGVKTNLGRKRGRRTGRIKMGRGKISGPCSRANISSTVRRRKGAIRGCYQKRLRTKPTLKGKIQMRWRIGAQGRVSKASVVQNTLRDNRVEQCVARTFRRMRFQKPKGGGMCIVQWPIVFR